MKNHSLIHLAARFAAIVVLIAAGLPVARPTSAQANNAYVYMVREIDLTELGVEGMEGLAYSPSADVLLALQNKSGKNGRLVSSIDRTVSVVGTAELQEPAVDPMNVAFNDQANSLFAYNPASEELVAIGAAADGKLPPVSAPTARYNLKKLGLKNSRGMDFESGTGRLFFLDPAGKRLSIVTPDAAGSYDGDRSASEGRVKRVSLKGIGENQLNGLAYNPNAGTLFTVGEKSGLLYEITENGDVVSTRDLATSDETYKVKKNSSMVFAPSGDFTDDPAIKSLYVAEPTTNSITEFSITAAAVMDLPSPSAITLVRTINSYAWSPPSPDTSGIDYNPFNNRLNVSDSEVEEMGIYEGKNVFVSTLTGSLQSTCVTTAFTKEPSGLTVNTDNGNLFFSDDSKKILHEVMLGPDGQYCTPDDQVRSTNMATYGSTDPEGIGYGAGYLLIADGTNAEVWVVSPGPNGIFNGAGAAGDDQVVTHFDTAGMGLRDPEGIDYNPYRNTIIVVSRSDKIIVETSLSGTVQRVFDITSLNAVSRSGIGVGPSSGDPSVVSIYMSARGVDNNINPNENDGKIYELSTGDPVVATPTPEPTTPTPITPTPTPTNTPTPPPGTNRVYLSLSSSGTGNLSFARDEDVFHFDGVTFSQYFDGSDVGVGGADVDAFHILDSSNLLLSFDSDIIIPNLGTVNEWDIVQFTATSFGDNTAGSFSMYFDGEDVELTTANEGVDAIDLLPDGRLLISTSGSVSVTGVSALDEDILAFTPSSLGSITAGTWSLYFDGSDVGLSTDSGEDIDALSVVNNGDIHLSTRNVFSVSGVSGTAVDVFTCTPTSLGDTTACNFSPTLLFTGATYGLSTNNIDGFELVE